MALHQRLDRERALDALSRLDPRVPSGTHLVIGGGAAMVLVYQHALATEDVDAFAVKGSASLAQIDGAAKAVARELDLEPDWLNSHFETYIDVLSGDFKERLRSVFRGANLMVDALGPEDLLVMKCFAARDKDRPHAVRLLRLANDLEIVDRRLTELAGKRYPKAQQALDYFDDLRDEVGV
jgi:predicted nucleotidyltransferase